MNYTLPRITKDTVELYAYTNKSILNIAPRGIVLDFHGLGGGNLKNDHSDFDKLCAENGILTVFPYYGPWSWMNEDAVKYVDEVVFAVCEREGVLPNEIPIISTGGSMGGLSALVYTKYAKVTPKACFTNCPVCDLLFHATERVDLPRTIYLAFNYGSKSLEEAMTANSPYHIADSMPDVPYYVIHGTADRLVNIDNHSRKFVDKMVEFGKNVTFIPVDGMHHCDIWSYPDIKDAYYKAIIDAI